MPQNQPAPASDELGAGIDLGQVAERERRAAPLIQAAGSFDDIEDEAANAFRARLLGSPLHGLRVRETTFTTQVAAVGIARDGAPAHDMVLISLRDQLRVAAPIGPHNTLIALTPPHVVRTWDLPHEQTHQVLHEVIEALTTARRVAQHSAQMRAAQVTAMEVEARIERRAAAEGVEVSWLMDSRQQASRVQMWQAAAGQFTETARHPTGDVVGAARQVRVLADELAALRRGGLAEWIANQPARPGGRLLGWIMTSLRVTAQAAQYRRELRAGERRLEVAINHERAARALATAHQDLANARALATARRTSSREHLNITTTVLQAAHRHSPTSARPDVDPAASRPARTERSRRAAPAPPGPDRPGSGRPGTGPAAPSL